MQNIENKACVNAGVCYCCFEINRQLMDKVMEEELKKIGVTNLEYNLVKPMTYHASITAPEKVKNSDIARIIYMNKLFGYATIGSHREEITGITGKTVIVNFDRSY